MRTRSEIEHELQDLWLYGYGGPGEREWTAAVEYALRWAMGDEPRGPVHRLRAMAAGGSDDLDGVYELAEAAEYEPPHIFADEDEDD